MKAKTLQIVWHEKDPVFSIDFHPDGYIATGGGDRDIKLWEVCRDAEGNPQVRYVSSLSAHTRSVNCVRFSHSGHCLASAADRGELIIWRPDPRAAATSPAPGAPPVAAAYGTPLPPSQPRDKASSSTPGSAVPFSPGEAPAAAVGGDGGWAQAGAWRQSATLRGHLNDVTDVAWAHDDAVVMSGSVDSEVMLFDVEGRKTLARLQGHRHYVQGVAWDPLGAWMISQSADRTVRVHGLKPPPSGSKSAAAAAAREGMRASTALARDVLHTHTLSKVAVQPPATPPEPAPTTGEEPAAAAQPAAAATTTAAAAAAEQPQKPLQAGLFHDESLNIFFRRPAWSPEGSLLAVPAGLYREHAGQQPQHATYLWARGHWGCPLLALPCPSKPSTVVRFCPCIFKLREQQQQQQQQQGGDSADAAGEQQQRQQESAAAGAAGVENVLDLPYSLVLAVATLDSVLLYDLQTCEPFMLVGPLHYAPITDLAWSRDGSCLAVSSHDGYCSMVTFQPGELGEAASMTDPGVLPEGLVAALQKVQAAAAATAAKAVGGGAGAAAQTSPKVVSVTPRPAAGTTTAAAGVGGDRTPAQAGGQQQAAKPRRVQPEAVPAAATDMGVIGSAAGGSSRPPAASGGGAAAGQPRRVTPQPVPAGQVFGAPAAFGAAPALGASSPVVPAAAAPGAAAAAGTPAGVAAAAAAAPAGAKSTPGPSPRQQQERAAKPTAAPAGAGKVAGAPAAGAGAGRVGLAAVQAALAAAKKKAAAKRAAREGGHGIPAAPAGDDDVVIVGEIAAAGEAGGVSKKPKTQ